MASDRYADLDIEEDITFERRAWRFQRAGRFGLALFLLLAVLGFTGSGPLSNASSRSSDHALTVSFERIDRISAPSTFELSFDPDLVSGGELQVWIDSAFISQVRMEQITPEPDRIEIDTDRYVFTFAVSALSNPAPISFQFRPEKPGISRTTIGIVDGPSTSLRQLVFP